MKTFFLLSVLMIAVMCGCASYHHQYTNTDGSKDDTRFGSFLMMGNASKIHSETKWPNYSRQVSVGALEGKGDAEMIQAIAAGIVEGLKKSQGIP